MKFLTIRRTARFCIFTQKFMAPDMIKSYLYEEAKPISWQTEQPSDFDTTKCPSAQDHFLGFV